MFMLMAASEATMGNILRSGIHWEKGPTENNDNGGWVEKIKEKFQGVGINWKHQQPSELEKEADSKNPEKLFEQKIPNVGEMISNAKSCENLLRQKFDELEEECRRKDELIRELERKVEEDQELTPDAEEDKAGTGVKRKAEEEGDEERARREEDRLRISNQKSMVASGSGVKRKAEDEGNEESRKPGLPKEDDDDMGGARANSMGADYDAEEAGSADDAGFGSDVGSAGFCWWHW